MIFRSENLYRRYWFRVVLTIVFCVLLCAFWFAANAIHIVSEQSMVVNATEVEDDKRIAVTFDDGPDPRHTLAIQSILLREAVPATFFFTGENMLSYPDIVRETYDNGFLIGNHSYSHSHNVHHSERRMSWELNTTNRILEQIIGRGTVLYRAPYLTDYENLPDEVIDGTKVNGSHPIRWISDQGYVNVSAFIGSDDYSAESPEEIIANIQAEIGAGNILLLHDGGGDRSATVEALPGIIALLRASGYEFVSLSDLMGVNTETLMPMSTDTPLLESVSVALAGATLIHTTWMFGALIWLVVVLSLARILLLLFYRALPYRLPTKPWRHGVSVIVPAYNESANIEGTIRSIFHSRHHKLEVIVVDDGSMDDTVALVEQLRQLFPKQLKLVRQSNAGKSAALNTGIRVALHPVIVTIDADTVLHPEAIGYLAAHFNDPRVGAVAGTVEVAKVSNLLTTFQAIEYMVSQFVEKQAANRMFNSVGVVPGAVGAWRRAELLAVGGYCNDTLVEDQDLTLAIQARNKYVHYEPRAIAYTEVPRTLSTFIVQRQRWVFGGIQCLWKYRQYFFSFKAPQLGLVIMPFTLIFGVLLTLFSPIIDILLFAQLIIGYTPALLSFVVLFIAVDLLYVSISFIHCRAPLRYWLMVPIQRVFYRFTIGTILMAGLVRAVEGRCATWGQQIRWGSAKRYFDTFLAKPEIISQP